MKKQHTSLIVSLTVIVIALCAVLPMLLFKLGDFVMDDKVYSAEVKSVQFSAELTDLERLYLIDRGMSTEITQDRTILKSEDMKEVLATSLTEYIDTGLLIVDIIEDFDVVSCIPYRCYSNEIANLSGTFWEIYLESASDPGHSLRVSLDDQTGKILLMSYECLEPIYDEYMVDVLPNALLDCYRNHMDMPYYIDEMNDENKKVQTSKSVRLYMTDMVYGEIRLKFTVSTSGFSIYIE